jgi:Arc/MetJ family transcription regulator
MSILITFALALVAAASGKMFTPEAGLPVALLAQDVLPQAAALGNAVLASAISNAGRISEALGETCTAQLRVGWESAAGMLSTLSTILSDEEALAGVVECMHTLSTNQAVVGAALAAAWGDGDVWDLVRAAAELDTSNCGAVKPLFIAALPLITTLQAMPQCLHGRRDAVRAALADAVDGMKSDPAFVAGLRGLLLAVLKNERFPVALEVIAEQASDMPVCSELSPTARGACELMALAALDSAMKAFMAAHPEGTMDWAEQVAEMYRVELSTFIRRTEEAVADTGFEHALAAGAKVFVDAIRGEAPAAA